MKALIIGAAGFVGHYLIQHLQGDLHWNIAATKMAHEKIETANIDVFDLDILDQKSIMTLLNTVRPDFVIHLAAQSSVSLSWKNPGLTVDVNIKGTINVLDAIRELNLSPRILLIGSGEEYGRIQPEDIPIKETLSPNPGNIYAATKACQNMIGQIYTTAYSLDIIMVRAFNHIGPGQSPVFVVSDFCKQVAEIEKGIRKPVMYVGNLDARRDFTDVRDVVKAYGRLIKYGRQGNIYNVGSGVALSIASILDIILTKSRIPIRVEKDSKRYRPVDLPIIEADIKKLTDCTGWQPVIPIYQTIEETLDFWRTNL